MYALKFTAVTRGTQRLPPSKHDRATAGSDPSAGRQGLALSARSSRLLDSPIGGAALKSPCSGALNSHDRQGDTSHDHDATAADRAPRQAFVSPAARATRHDRTDRRGSLSTLAPIFAVAFATHQPRYAFFAGLATAIGAGVSMAFSEGLSDTGDLTGRGNPYLRGAITGAGTFLGGVLHTLPFLIPQYHAALAVALATITLELVTLAWARWRFFGTGFLRSFVSIAIGGAIIAGVSAMLGAVT
ncbi:hypothetical protein ACFVW1_38610 [Streptomyces olivochromogenes]|uniref:hypothetical protein n=1 Tax=Streptomyces olivochromogenes TaxID=1963 RepID=UPI0036DEC3C3